MANYEISRPGGVCSKTGRAFEEGEEFYTAILEGEKGLERRDYAPEAWDGPPENTLCHFKTHLPNKKEPKKTFVDDEVMINFFLRLADAEEGLKQRFRFVLSLILLRKRLLKYVNTLREDGKEFWVMRLMRDKSVHRVFNPVLSEMEIEEVSGELSTILHGHAAAMEEEDSEENESDGSDEAAEPNAQEQPTEDSEEVETH